MKNRKSAQIASVMLALGMLTTYVVYSQRQSARIVAPSSKLIVFDELKKPESGNKSTNALTHQKLAVAPGSKSMAPVVAVRPRTSAAATNSLMSGAQRVMVAPGSKSGPVFDLPQAQAAVRPKLTPAPGPTNRVTNAAASVKPRP